MAELALRKRPSPPAPPRRPRVLVAHGDERVDDWYWLRNADDPQVRDHLQAENAYADSVLSGTAGLQEQLYRDIKSRIQESDTSTPARKGEWWYYARSVEGLPYTVHCRLHDPERSLTGGEAAALVASDREQVVLDENRLAGTNPHFSLGVVSLSPDQSLVAYAVDRTGVERHTLRFREVASGADLDDVVEDVYYSSAWSTDNTSFFYVRVDAAMRPHQVWRHTLGRPVTEDVLVFTEDDERFHVQVGLTRSERYIVIGSHARLTSEVHFLDAGSPTAEPRLVEPRHHGVVYVVEDAVLPDRGQVWLILTNEGDAENFAIHSTPLADPGRANWKVLLGHRPEVKLESIDTFGAHAVVVEREDGLRHLNVIRLADGASHRIEQPEPVYTVTNADSLEFDTATVRFGYTSLVTPQSTIEYDFESRNRQVLKQEPVGGGYDPVQYEAERLWASAPDGTQVPISLVRPRDLPLDGSAPCILYGYGAYEVTIEPSFSPALVGLLERGFVFAIAHVRGGGELGRHWYEDGSLRQKRNTFTDCIACAEHLTARGYTSPDRLGIRSRSAGGLLLGAVANMRPELFAGVVAEVPFVDCVTTLLDETLPLTVAEWDEWGNPVADPDAYAYLKSYSPYDNVRAAAYPAMYVTAARNDQRVGYWEPAKWVVKLRERQTADRPILLWTDLGVGHAGSSARYDAWREEARVQAFILSTVGIPD